MPHSHEQDDSISIFLQLPTVLVPHSKRAIGEEPLIDYLKSIFMTMDNYIDLLEVLVARRHDATRAREARKIEAKAWKQRCRVEKVQCKKRKKYCEEERATSWRCRR